jgi:methylated-DNA-[protein]-cysteine S-methyltransferase
MEMAKRSPSLGLRSPFPAGLPAGLWYHDSMTECAFAFFDTAIGRCALAWNEAGICAVLLPASDAAMRKRIRALHPDAEEQAPPPETAAARDLIVQLLKGENVDLSGIRIDIGRVPSFHAQVFEVARTIRPGETLTYGEIAHRIGAPQEAREVGQALGQNPFPIIVPCHRVLGKGGKMVGFSAPGGITTKRRLLAIEGALPPSLFD